MKFSIIIPVYNVNDYIDECLSSILNQSFKDFEILLVDDGSTDGSEIKCERHAEADARVRVIHKENGGASSARNTGLDNALGDFIIFIDSDDYWNDLRALEQLADIIEKNNADLVVFGCTDFNHETGEHFVSRGNYNLSLINKGERNETLHYFLSNQLLPGGPTIFTFSRQCILNKHICFKEGIQDEDYDFVLSVFLYAKSVYAINNPFYMYRKGRKDSVTGLSDIRMIYGIDYTIEKWFNKCSEIKNETIKNDVLNYLAYMFCTGLVITGRMSEQDKNKSCEILTNNQFILKYALWSKPRIIRFALNFVSIKKLSAILANYYDKTHI